MTYGTTYSIDVFNKNPGAGVTVAVFGQNRLTPGCYGVGTLALQSQHEAGLAARRRT